MTRPNDTLQGVVAKAEECVLDFGGGPEFLTAKVANKAGSNRSFLGIDSPKAPNRPIETKATWLERS